MTRLIVVADEAEGGDAAAEIVAGEISSSGSLVLGIATGSTPLTTWSSLSRRRLDLSRIDAFALDEYIGLPVGHPASFEEVVRTEVVEPLGLDPARVHVPTSHGVDPHLAAERYERRIVDGGVDVQVLGIGRNGHIAFNEPGSSLRSTTRVARLSPETREDNARFFSSPDDVPIAAITQGIGTIARARRLVLLAFGYRKAAALAAALEGPVGRHMPASIIQRHRDAVVIADRHAAGLISASRQRMVSA